MAHYRASIREIHFVLDNVAGLAEVLTMPAFQESTSEEVDSILGEAVKIAEGTLAPLNHPGDLQGAELVNGKVKVAEGWQDAWNVLVDGGWNSLPFPTEFGGMGLPNVLNTAVMELWQTANMSFALCPMLTQGAVGALLLYGTPEQKKTYLPKMITGEWTGVMDLTEPQAGSDLSAIRTKAVPEGDHYRITGHKIFITYGDHEMTSNIIHLVLGRLPDAPPGVKGISLFLVPKYVLNEKGEPGKKNDITCVTVENKLGIHASPTTALSFGDEGGAVGYLIGLPHRGLEYMFAMMNHARQAVGLQGLAIAERAYNKAISYARERIQGAPVSWPAGTPTPGIIYHPDVRRMAMEMKTHIAAIRGLLYTLAAEGDFLHHHPDAARREQASRLIELLTPVAKGWSTEIGNYVASLGLQIHGGSGYMATGSADQYFRDARITTIYEGTTAIQANDLVNRKTLRDGGEVIRGFLNQVRAEAQAMAKGGIPALTEVGTALDQATVLALEVVSWIIATQKKDPRQVAAGAVNFLYIMGLVVGGYYLAQEARAAARKAAEKGDEDGFLAGRATLSAFHAACLLPQVTALHKVVTEGTKMVMSLDEPLM